MLTAVQTSCRLQATIATANALNIIASTPSSQEYWFPTSVNLRTEADRDGAAPRPKAENPQDVLQDAHGQPHGADDHGAQEPQDMHPCVTISVHCRWDFVARDVLHYNGNNYRDVYRRRLRTMHTSLVVVTP